MPLVGLADLERRIEAVAHAGDGMARAWADETADKMRQRVAVRSGETRASIASSSNAEHGEVTGSPVLIFIDRGTRAHTVTPKSATVLRFDQAGRPLFRPRAALPRMAARPFIADSSSEAVADHVSTDAIVAAWNGAA